MTRRTVTEVLAADADNANQPPHTHDQSDACRHPHPATVPVDPAQPARTSPRARTGRPGVRQVMTGAIRRICLATR